MSYENMILWFRCASILYMHGINKSIRKLIQASLQHDTHRLLRCFPELLDIYRLVHDLIHREISENNTMLHDQFVQNVPEKTLFTKADIDMLFKHKLLHLI